MVCLGPRKKEKKNNLLSPDEAGTGTSRGLKKSKLKKPSTGSLAPSVANTVKKSPTRTSLDSIKSSARPPARNSLLPNGRTPSPVHRSTSPHKPPSSRPTSIASVKSLASRNTATTTTTPSNPASRTPSNVSTAKRFPITEMKEEVKGLKAKVSRLKLFVSSLLIISLFIC